MVLVLRPCPFCGKTPESKVFTHESDYLVFHIRCQNCDYSFSHREYIPVLTIDRFFEKIQNGVNEITNRWNTRVDYESSLDDINK